MKETHFFKSLKGIGFKFTNCILNLGNTGQVLAFEIVSLFMIGLYYLYFKYTYTNKSHRRYYYLKKKMCFKPFLGLCFNGFIPLCISTTINWKYPCRDFYGEYVG